MDKTANPGKTARLTYTGKISAAAASLGALYLAPGAAQAIVMQGTGGPLSVTLGSGAVVYWDIDGDNQRDFVLWNNNFGSYGYINLASISTGPNLGSGPINGRGIVQLTGSTIRKITRLSNSFQVGPTLASGYRFNTYFSSLRTVIDDAYGPAEARNNFVDGSNILGLQFLIGGAAHFAWADINVDLSNRTVTIDEWFWESEARTAIHVGDRGGPVPEPGMAGLTLLGLGAIGLAAWRRRKGTAAETLSP